MYKRWAILGILIMVVGAAAWLALPEKKVTTVEKRASENSALNYSLPDLNGAMHSLPEGEVVLLNFWATWCPPCRREMPSMQKLHEKLAAKGLKIVAVSVDKEKADIIKFREEMGLTFQILRDESANLSKQYGVRGYPETFLIDRHGIVRYKWIGEVNWVSDSIVKKIEGILNESGEQPAG